jgi:hypothetical protein
MKLTESERRFIKKAEQRERSWQWIRWGALVGSAVVVAIAGWSLVRLLDQMTDGGPALAWFTPFAWFTLIGASGLLGWTLSHWQGDVKTRLLTRLVGEHNTTSAQPGAPPNGGPGTPFRNPGATEGPPSVS